MSNTCIDISLALILLLDICLVSSSRLLHCIRLCALQGMLIGIFPCLGLGHHNIWAPLVTGVVAFCVKGIILPGFLANTMRKCDIRRELEPLIPYGTSLVVLLFVCLGAFAVCGKIPVQSANGRLLALPTAFVTIFAGLFLIVTRRKAIVQALGFLCFENGIGLFGMVMHLENGLMTELGILLDVLVLTFIMGITILNIQKTFSHIDADRLNLLDDSLHSQND